MNKFLIRQISIGRKKPHQYELSLNEEQILIESGNFNECLDYVYKMIRKGDYLAEIEIGDREPIMSSYEQVMESKRLNEAFDNNEL